MDWIYHGRCWKFGDNLAVDADLTKKEFALQRETRPEILREFCMCGIDPDFPKKVSPRDIVVAGRRFAQGNPHIQGLLGIAALSLGAVVESIPRGSYRNAVNAGLPILPHCDGVTKECETGDELRVDFATGSFENLTRGTKHRYEPLPATLLETIALGGWRPMVAQRIAKLRAEGRIAAA
ncbi:MAG TPA: 3-isopropylmalate dehydratase [Alphaproteobacteria bacterium]|nr:3-isopropylmalate dehydratase [Alphaproteobacteria bacterium]